MKTYDNAIKAIEKSGLNFNYNIQVNDAGHCTHIVNLDARNPNLVRHSNDQLAKIRINSAMAIKDMANEIRMKWKKA